MTYDPFKEEPMRNWKLMLAAVVASLVAVIGAMNLYQNATEDQQVSMIESAADVADAVMGVEDAKAQVFFANTRVGKVVYSHSSVGTSAADAVTSVEPNLLAWKICADGANTGYIAASVGADPDTDGVRIKAGECVDCPNCTPKTLRDLNVKSDAAAQGYSVLQYRQQ